jgi:predicted regulator of amino acid metabolism with ACT domain
MSNTTLKISCRDHVLEALIATAADRSAPNCEERERAAVCIAANQWAEAHGINRRVTVSAVERVEHQALGHSDYMSKLALYVAEAILWEPPK